MCHRLMVQYSSHLTAFAFFFKGNRIVCRKSSGHFPLCIYFLAKHDCFLQCLLPQILQHLCMLSIHFALLFFISLMAANISSLRNSDPFSSSPSSSVSWPNLLGLLLA